MNDEFLKYYQRELTWLRHKGGEFAERHPKIASRLKMTEDHIEDPHVSRLLEGMAFISAQIRQSLDDSFPQLTEALIGELFPDFHAPIPSMSMVHHRPSLFSDSRTTLPIGSRVDIHAPSYQTCQYRTTSEADIWPFEVSKAEYLNAPFSGPEVKFEQDSAAMLKVTLQCHDGCSNFVDLNLERLTFHLNGQAQTSHALFQLLFRRLQGIVLMDEVGHRYDLPLKHFSRSDDSALVPYDAHTFSGYRKLVEYFLMPEKFLFFDLKDLNPDWFGLTSKVTFFFFFSDSVLLGCTPVINLFDASLEPLRLSPTVYEYELRPAHRKAEMQEVIKINRVTLTSSQIKDDIEVLPYYNGEHPNHDNHDAYFWSMRREDASWAGGFDEPGRHIYLSVTNQHFSPEIIEKFNHANLVVRAECSNRNIPTRLPYGGGQPQVSVKKNADAKGSRCLMPLSATVRPKMEAHTRWQFAKLLTINSFSDHNGLRNLKEMLKLFDFKGSPNTKVLTDAILSLTINQTTARVNQRGRVGFCYGSEITIAMQTSKVDQDQLYLFGQILSDFFAQFAEVNSFTQLQITLQPSDTVYHRWPAMAGEKPLL